MNAGWTGCLPRVGNGRMLFIVSRYSGLAYRLRTFVDLIQHRMLSSSLFLPFPGKQTRQYLLQGSQQCAYLVTAVAVFIIFRKLPFCLTLHSRNRDIAKEIRMYGVMEQTVYDVAWFQLSMSNDKGTRPC